MTQPTTYHQGAAGLLLPKRGSIWRHYKGNLYRVVLLAMAPDATTWVVYAPVMGEGISQHFCQPLSRWHEAVNGITRMIQENA